MNTKVVGIDLAKDVFQLCALDQGNRVLYNRRLRRKAFLRELHRLPPTVVAMEACSSAHHFGRLLQSLGHQVRLIPAQHVRAYVRNGKSDAKDALAICEACQRPLLHTVPVKTVAQQDLQLLHRVRSRHIQTRTALANQIRSIAREYGLVFPLTLPALRRAIADALEDADNGLSPAARSLIAMLVDELRELDTRIAALKDQIEALACQHPAYERLRQIPGFGPLVASAWLAAVGDGRQFQRGRQLSAWLGLVPRQYSSGDKNRQLGISKNGDRYLRTLLIHGARVVASWCQRRLADQRPMARWLRALIARRGKHKAIVALANKLARVAWVVLAKDQPFDPGKAFAGA